MKFIPLSLPSSNLFYKASPHPILNINKKKSKNNNMESTKP